MNMWKYYITVGLIMCWTATSFAVEPENLTPEQAKEDAIERFKQGVTNFDNKDFEGALVDFETAYELNPSWKLFYNIAHCQAALKLYGMAVTTFERYLAEGGDQVPDARRDEVLAELERMRKMIGDIEIVAPDGLEVYIDNIHRGKTPLPGVISVSAGLVHKIELRENDAVMYESERIVRGGGVARVEYTLEEPTVEPQPAKTETVVGTNPEIEMTADPVPANKRTRLSPVPFAFATGATVLLGGTTIALAAYISAQRDKMESKNDADSLNTLRKVGIGTLAGTAAAGITAVILAIFTDFKGEQKSSPVTFYSAPHEGGVILSGRF